MMLLMMVMIIQADDDYNEDYDGDYDNEDDDEYDMSQQTFLLPLTIGQYPDWVYAITAITEPTTTILQTLRRLSRLPMMMAGLPIRMS